MAAVDRITANHAPSMSHHGPHSEDGASSHRMGYFDKYPARAMPARVADGESNTFSPSAPASLNGHGQAPRKTRPQRSASAAQATRSQQELPKLAWPSKPEAVELSSRSSSPESSCPKTVNQSNSSHKSRARNSVASTVPELRYSASTAERSSLSPPQTPVGPYSSPFSADTVVVAAPVLGVDMMDALVAGMNGALAESSSDGNDFRIPSRSKRHGARKHLSSLEKRHPGLHPHSTPPLPKPPHGVKLGGPDNKRNAIYSEIDILGHANDHTPARTPRAVRPRVRSTTNPDPPPPSPTRSSTDPVVRKNRSSTHLRKSKTSGTSHDTHTTNQPTIDQIIKGMVTRAEEPPSPGLSRPSAVPSIQDIIRTHAPELAKTKMGRPQRPSTSPALPTSLEETEHDEDPAGRSSLDSITNEARVTVQKAQNSPLHHAKSFPTRPFGPPPSTYGGLRSMRYSESEQDLPPANPRYAQSVVSASSYGYEISSTVFTPPPPDSAMAIAQYLRSPRLTRLMTLRKPPHRGLTVSLADVGNPNGLPVLVFLGLGCVRYLVALYDEMAEALGLRLIAIDRWGMGRTADVPQEQRGLKEWAAVCEEVLDTLGVSKCGILAHSAGAPYALAFALRAGPRLVGSIHLLAPWVGGGIDAAGYKWLKYVPNSFIKAAQNAEWKMHGWKLGKPPTIVYEGIGNDPQASASAPVTITKSSSNTYLPLTAEALKGVDYTPPSSSQAQKADDTLLGIPKSSPGGVPRTSLGGWSDYDDLADFEGRFGSQTTLPLAPPVPPLPDGVSNSSSTKKKVSNRLFGMLKSPGTPPSETPSPVLSGYSSSKNSGGKNKGLRTITSLKHKLSGQKNPSPANPSMPKLEANLESFGAGLGIDVEFKSDVDRTKTGIEAWATGVVGSSISRPTSPVSADSHTFPRTKRSISLTASMAPTSQSLGPSTPNIARAHSSPMQRPLSGESGTFSIGSNYHAPPKALATTNAPTSSVATALLRASHKEAQKGLANDLLSILERDAKPWGFSYADVRQKVKVWYGDKDEKIGEGGIRWMERVMQDCEVTICKGRDHSLMTCAPVVVEALESLQEELRRDVGVYP